MLFSSGSQAQSAATSESQLKAAFLFNFAKFVEWPSEAFAESTSPFIIGVLDDSAFAKELEQTVAAKRIDNHPISIQVFRAGGDIGHCHILFMSARGKDIPEVIRRLNGRAVLTVGETERFIETGGMINFISEKNKIRFQINHDAAKAARLTVSSKLLNLAVHRPR